MIRGVGPIYARKLVAGIGPKRAGRIVAGRADQKVIREIMLFLAVATDHVHGGTDFVHEHEAGPHCTCQ